jgi:hypothetical protein
MSIAQQLRDYRGERFTAQSFRKQFKCAENTEIMPIIKKLQAIYPEIQIEGREFYWDE